MIMKLVRIENNTGTVVAESDNIESLQKLAASDSRLQILKEFPIPGFKVVDGKLVEQSIQEKIQSGMLKIEDLRDSARHKIRSEIDAYLENASTHNHYKVDRYSREKAMTSLNLISSGKSNLAFYPEAQCLEMLDFLKTIDSKSSIAYQEIEETTNPDRLISISFAEFLN